MSYAPILPIVRLHLGKKLRKEEKNLKILFFYPGGQGGRGDEGSRSQGGGQGGR